VIAAHEILNTVENVMNQRIFRPQRAPLIRPLRPLARE